MKTFFERSLFIFLLVLPLVNGLFDFLSYGVTLALMRLGLRGRHPFVWGLADLAVAAVLFVLLGGALIAIQHGLNGLAIRHLVDLPGLFASVRARPQDFLWLYLMLFSTILPTGLHAALSLISLQGVTPRPLRRRVARWVEDSPQVLWKAVLATALQAAFWTVPLAVAAFVGWVAWQFAGGFLTRAGLAYLNMMEAFYALLQ